MLPTTRSVFVGLALATAGVLPAQGSCDVSLEYSVAKSTGFQALNINNATSAQGAGQWFDAPGAVTITGVTFYAYRLTGVSVTVDVSIFMADSNRLPTGAPLATTSQAVTNDIGAGTLLEQVQSATFASPVTVAAPYVVVVANHSPTGLSLMTNSWSAMPPDGAGESLSSADLFGAWISGSNLNVGGFPFDADWLFEPTVQFDATPAFTPDQACVVGPATVTFANQSVFALNRFYNRAAFSGTPEASFTWDYGDGTATESAVSPQHAYAGAGPHFVQLTSTVGWGCTRTASSSTTLVAQPAASAFSWTMPFLVATFTDESVGADGWLWDFGDGSTSTEQNPVHTYAAPGSYLVCLTATNACGSTTSCQTVERMDCEFPVATGVFGRGNEHSTFGPAWLSTTAPPVYDGAAGLRIEYGNPGSAALIFGRVAAADPLTTLPPVPIYVDFGQPIAVVPFAMTPAAPWTDRTIAVERAPVLCTQQPIYIQAVILDSTTPSGVPGPFPIVTTNRVDWTIGDPPALVITEIMHTPVGIGSGLGDWFEVYNPTSEAVDINGWMIRDDDGDSYTIGGAQPVQPGAFYVFAHDSDPRVNGALTRVNYAWGGGFELDVVDEIELFDPNSGVVDRVAWGGDPAVTVVGTFPQIPGAAMSLSPSLLNSGANDFGLNWCAASSGYGAGSLFGTPGLANDACSR